MYQIQLDGEVVYICSSYAQVVSYIAGWFELARKCEDKGVFTFDEVTFKIVKC